MTNDIQDILGKETWMRGMWLGFLLIVFFALGAGIIFLLSALTGWGIPARLIASLLLGPVLGTPAFVVYWRIKKPVIVSTDHSDPA